MSMGVGLRQAGRIAAAEFSSVKSRLLQQSSAEDQRVMPHERGWIVTRSLDEVRARFFERFADAVQHAKREARTALTSAILVYDEDGRALLRIDLPRWRTGLA